MRIRTVRNANPQSLNQVFKILTNENVQHKTKPREFRLSMKSKSIGKVDNPLSSFPQRKTIVDTHVNVNEARVTKLTNLNIHIMSLFTRKGKTIN